MLFIKIKARNALSVVFLLDDQEFLWIWGLIGFCQLLGRETVNKTKKNTICGAHHYKQKHTNNVNRNN
jgi:hypothetical protein